MNVFFRNVIPSQYRDVLAFCGLRGSMALALAIRARHDFGGHVVRVDPVTGHAEPAHGGHGGHGDELLSCALIYALITILPMGSSAPYVLQVRGKGNWKSMMGF